MKVDVIRDNISFRKMKNSWDRIYSLGSYSIFQSFSYNYYAWKYILSSSINNQLFIVVVSDRSKIIAILPFYKDSYNTIRFINDIHSDFCDIICRDYFDINILFKKLGIEKYSLMN